MRSAGIAFGLVVLFAACSSSETTSPSVVADGGADAGTDTGADAALPPDAGTSRLTTAIMIERWARTSPAAEHTIAAALSFHQGAEQPHLLPVDANCRYHEPLTWSGGSPDYGTFQLTANAIGTVTFSEAKAYEPASGFGWDTGDAITVATTGGAIPAFTLSDTVPAQATLTSHDLPSLQANQLVIPRDVPFALTWTPVSTEVFALVLQFDAADAPRKGLWCFYPGAAGAASIPTAALAHLLGSTDVTSTNFYFGGASRKSTTLERTDVEMITWKAAAARVVIQ